MPLPTDFDSFVGGFDLTSENYSGGAGGTFSNMLSGAADWTVQGATPSFETRGALEGMLFTNDSTESVIGRMPMLHEGTIVIIAEPDDGTELGMLGGSYASGTSWDMRVSSTTLQVRAPTATTASSGTNWTSGEVAVFSGSWHPETGTLYSQVNTDTAGTGVSATKSQARINWSEGAIGRARTTYFSGWIARVLFFNQALHAEDNTAFQALLADEVARLNDNTAPVILIADVTRDVNDLDVEFNTDEDGTGYVVVVPADDGVPSEAEMVAGQASGGGAPLADVSGAVVDGGILTADITGLEETVDVYAMVQDAAGNNSNIAAEEDFVITPLPEAPSVTSAVTVPSADVGEGADITATTGVFDGYPVPTLTQQWQRSADGSTGWTNVSGATALIYTTVTADVGYYFRIVQTATNSEGSVSSTSAATGVVTAGLVAPSTSAVPTLPGAAPEVGVAFTATTGTYTGNPTPTITQQWQRSDDGSTGWTDISGATSPAYTPVTGDAEKYLRLVETATNSEGSSTGTSAASLQIPALPAFDPETDLADIVEWWDAETGITATNTTFLQTWLSALTGGTTIAREAGEGAAPTTASTTQNGLNVVEFDGSNDNLLTAVYGTPIFPSFTLVAGNASTFYGQIEELGGDFTDSTVDTTDREGLGLWEVIFDASGGTYTLRHNQVEITSDTYTGSETAHLVMALEIIAGGVTDANDALFTQMASGEIKFGRNEGGQYGNFNLFEVIVCDAEITGSDLADLTSYLNTRWDLGLTPEAPSVDAVPTLPAAAPADGVAFTATAGSYNGTPTPTISGYQWQLSADGSTGWADISGATSITYTPQTSDVGSFIRVQETATNSEGSVTGTSAASLEITAAAAFSDPSSLPNTVEWWDPTQGITTTDGAGERPSEWATALASGTTLLRVSGESLGPSTNTRTLNSLNVLDFDGSNDQMRENTANTTMPEFSFSAGNASTFYGKLDSESGDFTDVTGSAVDRSGAALWEIQIDSIAGTITLLRDGTQVCQSTDLSWGSSANAHIFIAADIDGSGNANDSIFTNSSSVGIRIGQYWGGQYGDFGCGDVVICNAILSGSDLTDMRSWFNTRWGF